MLINFFSAPLIAVLQHDQAFTKIPTKYADYADIFFVNLAINLPDNTDINNYIIELV